MGRKNRRCFLGFLIFNVCLFSCCNDALSRKDSERNLRLTYVAFKEFRKTNTALPSLNDNEAYFTSYFGKRLMNWRVVIQYVTPLGSHDLELDSIQMRESIERSGAMFFERGDQRIYANLPSITALEVNERDACILFAYLPKDEFAWYEDDVVPFWKRLEEYCSTASNQEVLFLLNDGRIGTFLTRHFKAIAPLLDPNSAIELRQESSKYLRLIR